MDEQKPVGWFSYDKNLAIWYEDNNIASKAAGIEYTHNSNPLNDDALALLRRLGRR